MKWNDSLRQGSPENPDTSEIDMNKGHEHIMVIENMISRMLNQNKLLQCARLLDESFKDQTIKDKAIEIATNNWIDCSVFTPEFIKWYEQSEKAFEPMIDQVGYVLEKVRDILNKLNKDKNITITNKEFAHLSASIFTYISTETPNIPQLQAKLDEIENYLKTAPDIKLAIKNIIDWLNGLYYQYWNTETTKLESPAQIAFHKAVIFQRHNKLIEKAKEVSSY